MSEKVHKYKLQIIREEGELFRDLAYYKNIEWALKKALHHQKKGRHWIISVWSEGEWKVVKKSSDKL